MKSRVNEFASALRISPSLVEGLESLIEAVGSHNSTVDEIISKRQNAKGALPVPENADAWTIRSHGVVDHDCKFDAELNSLRQLSTLIEGTVSLLARVTAEAEKFEKTSSKSVVAAETKAMRLVQELGFSESNGFHPQRIEGQARTSPTVLAAIETERRAGARRLEASTKLRELESADLQAEIVSDIRRLINNKLAV